MAGRYENPISPRCLAPIVFLKIPALVYVDSLTVMNRGELAPMMGAKLNSKTHLQNRFFDFYSRFSRVLCQSLEKVLI